MTLLSLFFSLFITCAALDGSNVENYVIQINPQIISSPENNVCSALTKKGTQIYISGQRGKLADGSLVSLEDGGLSRIRQAYRNMKLTAETQGVALQDCERVVDYVTDIMAYKSLIDQVQSEEEFWGMREKPPTTLVQVADLSDNDIIEVEGTFLKKF